MHRILLAEDDDAIVRLLTDFLREEGFAVTAAAGERSAREALEQAAREAAEESKAAGLDLIDLDELPQL